ncbi:alpha/beta fold hydrolase [Oceaniovalibus sp. ACAM 378]|uniref:alpha/beta fold hydrolase n=1 Tax=Oceaniovalibus sp. ACAM 378 TaxID=2599923 RepID=UPI0011D90BFB|nr:alpha/beta fold hydrolase [Oceaniovalibus sp. ACAM 378]TYB88621.1 alpha/beta fold hydrolase [Oceaniovalibus sp. ACAM 378]
MIWLLLVLGALLITPLIAERLRRPPREALRASGSDHQQPRNFADLPGGRTHYRWIGPDQGPVAVCIHGLTTPLQIYGPIAEGLAEAGYRVLCYDLPGRGYSDPVPGRQDRAFFLAQLNGLLADQNIGRIELLVGYSMGGSIATVATALAPERVGALVLLAPAGLFHNAGWLAETLRRVPVLGDAVMLTLGGILMRHQLRQGAHTALTALQIAQTRQRGFLPAVLSSQRHLLAENIGVDHRAVRAAGVPTLAVWGLDDTVIPISNIGRLAEVQRDARQETVSGATHAMPYSHPGDVLDHIALFLSEI